MTTPISGVATTRQTHDVNGDNARIYPYDQTTRGHGRTRRLCVLFGEKLASGTSVVNLMTGGQSTEKVSVRFVCMSVVQSVLATAWSVWRRCLKKGRKVGRGAEIECEKGIWMRGVDRMLHSKAMGQLFSDHAMMGNSKKAR
jgi:hypothetical protein